MQQTFQINTGDLNNQFIKSVKAMFGNRDVKIVIEDVVETDKPINQKELYKKSLALRELFKDVIVPKDVNLSDLANEVNL